jgi:dipeptidyl-peptidase-4
MKRTLFALALLIPCAAVARAAEPAPAKPVDTSFLKKYAETRRFMLGRPQSPKVAPDGKAVLFLRAAPDDPKLKLFEFDTATGRTKEVLSPAALLKGGEESLTPEEKARRERMRLSAGGFADFHFDKTGASVLLPLSGRLFVFERATGKVTELKTGAGGAVVDPKWSPDGKRIAYVRGFDVYVYDLASGKESAVTTGGTITKTHGLAEFVAQEEMGRFSGYWWSPSGDSIAYEEADHTGVERWYVADPFKPGQKPAEQFYPRPGKKNVSVRLGVVPVQGGETVWVEWDRDKYEYLAKVEWQKYGPLTVMLQDRKQRIVDLFEVNSQTGQLNRLFSLKTQHGSGEWINLDHVAIYWAKDRRVALQRADEMVVITETGDVKPEIRDITSFFINIDKIAHFDTDTGGGVFQATSHPHRMHAFLLKYGDHAKPLRVNEVVQLTSERGVHTVAGTAQFPIVTSTTPKSMPVVNVFNADGNLVGTLSSVAEEPKVTPNVEFIPDPPEPRFHDSGKTQDNPPDKDECFAAIVRPRDFDPKKRYPVVVDVYGGPKHLHVQQAMRNWLIPQWLADQGFIVVAIENRGTPGRGREWESAVYQKFGTVPLEDQVKGLHLLCDKYPEMDRDRVGIVGWSFGGYMAANGVLRRPDVFKAAVAGAPVTDWADYDTHYTERYMGLLPESKKAYEEASLIPLAKDLKRPLLLVHGTADDNVYYRHTLKLSDALFRAGRDFEALALPGVTHMYTADPLVTERLWSKTATFFKSHLGEPK